MTTETTDPERFRFVASYVAGRSLDVAEAPVGQCAFTNGRVVFVSAAGSADQQRREVLVQSALLGAGSLDRRIVSRLRGRPSLARRYLAVEGHRVLAGLTLRVAHAAQMCPEAWPFTHSADESLAIALSRRTIAEAPPWFGMIRPGQLTQPPPSPGSAPSDNDLQATPGDDDLPAADDDTDDDMPTDRSRILTLFEAPFGAQTANFLRKMFGSSRSVGSETAGAELSAGATRRASAASAHARPVPTPILFTDADRPGAVVGIGGALYPEWDVFGGRYRPDWCRVVDFPVTNAADVGGAVVPRDDVLRRRLSRVGLGPKVLRARPDGDDLDTEALIDLFVDLRSGHSPPEHVYTERRKLARNLGVLILLDVSGSVTDADPAGLAVHDHQRRAAAILAATLDDLGDRVAVYGFWSQGRRSVHLAAIKTFGQRFGALARARLSQMQPSGYTRLGAGIRGAGEILKRDAGTPNRLLLVLSDGYPYDDGYEGRYAEADSSKALEELRADGVGCLCLSLGSATDAASLERVFGAASHAAAATLTELSPRMDELFLTALSELSAPRPNPV